MSRERAIVARVSRLGAVSVEQIGRQFGVSRSLAAEQVRRRLESIPRAWRRAGHVMRCVHVCPPSTPTQQVVHAAVLPVRADDEVRVLELRRALR